MHASGTDRYNASVVKAILQRHDEHTAMRRARDARGREGLERQLTRERARDGDDEVARLHAELHQIGRHLGGRLALKTLSVENISKHLIEESARETVGPDPPRQPLSSVE